MNLDMISSNNAGAFGQFKSHPFPTVFSKMNVKESPKVKKDKISDPVGGSQAVRQGSHNVCISIE